MSTSIIIKKSLLAYFTVIFLTSIAAAQYTISGYTDCLIPGYSYGPYHITGSWTYGETGQWCVTGGTIGVSGNSCQTVTVNGGVPDISVLWNAGATSGTVSYYRTGTPTPLATITVSLIGNTVSASGYGFIYPFVPLNQLQTITISGSDISTYSCNPALGYVWQKSLNGSSYSTIAGANTKDLLISEAFSQTTYYRRVITDGTKTLNSNVIQLITSSAINPGIVSPAYKIIKAGQSPATTFTATTASGGSMCGGNYSYIWETSTDNQNWISTGVTGLNYTPGILSVKTYIRQRVQCGPVSGFTNIAIVDIYKALSGGTVSPVAISIPINTSPGVLTCNPAKNGNTTAGYYYQWQYSNDNFVSDVHNIAGANSLNFNPGNIAANVYYRRKVTCDGVDAYSSVSYIQVYSGTLNPLQNYVSGRTLMRGGITDISSADGLTDLRDVKQTTDFFDGIGRPMETVIKQGSLATNSSPTDLVFCRQYDRFGNEPFKYLPYVSGTTDGSFKSNSIPEQNAFNLLLFPNEDFYYGQSDYESSPLNRIIASGAPGISWIGNNRVIQSEYTSNTILDAVRVWNVTNSAAYNTFGSYNSPTIYTAGTLYKQIKYDENGKQVIIFSDKDGNTILKKIQLTASSDDGTGCGYTGWLCTYYIYDNLENLRCVIQPQAVKMMSNGNNWDINPYLDEQCFRYEYDQRNRMVMKKTPGVGEVYMVYDARDRLIMTQDAKMRIIDNKWLVTLYDDKNRPIETGLLLNTWNNYSFIQHLSAASSGTDYPFTTLTTPSASYWELLSVLGYDNYLSLPGALTNNFDNSWATYFNNSFNVSPLYAQQQVATTQTTGLPTWTQVKVLGTTGTFLYSVNIYDDKGRIIQAKRTNITGGIEANTTQYNWAGQPLVTVQKLEKSASPAQTSVVVTQFSYDELNRLVKIEKKVSNTLVNNNVMSAYKTIVQNEYNNLGQLKNKILAPDYNYNAGLEKEKFEYNIRGWLLGMNRDYVRDENSINYFGFDLGYDKANNNLIGGQTYNNPQYNGNIEGMVWKSRGNGEKRKYDFSYDAVNRLMKADFGQYTNGVFDQTAGFNYNLKMGDGSDVSTAYDYNGNILQMQQWGLKMNTSSQIDNLRYSYFSNSNRLNSVTDLNNDAVTKLDDFKTNITHPQYSAKSTLTTSSTQAQFDAIHDYTYDVNGNLSLDNNKGISSILYNHLNLPKIITVAGRGTITYTYDAAGNKLNKITIETGATVPYNGSNYTNITITTTTFYLDGAVFENKAYSNSILNDALGYADRLQYILQEEGRIRFNPIDNSLQYDYFLKDHLGNVRMVLTEEQRMDQYPASTLEGNLAGGALSMINYEKKFYTINDAYLVLSSNMPGWSPAKDYSNNNGNPPYNLNYPSGTTPAATETSTKVYKLNALTNKTGLGIVIKVMAGDRIDIHGKSYYQSSTTYNNGNSTLLTIADLIGAFMGSPDNAGFTEKGITSPTMQTINTGLIPGSFFRGNDNTSSNIPKAYINYIFFDEQFKYAGGGFSRVGASGVVKNHWFEDPTVLQNIPAPKNGYLYVYVTNESNDNVFFDNLQVMHTRGPILEETHFYPFGLTMSGLSSKALNFGNPGNKNRFNGKEMQAGEFNDGSGLEEYDYGARLQDPQLGLWHNPDPLSDLSRSWSPYNFTYNNPIKYIDPDGMDPVGADGLTTAQWLESSKPGSNPNLTDQFRKANINTDQRNHNNSDMVMYIRTKNLKTNEIRDIVIGNISNESPEKYTSFGNSPISLESVKDIIPVGLGPQYIGFIFVMENYEVHSKKLNFMGVMVNGMTLELRYLDNNSGYSDFEWIQTVRETSNGKTRIFADPLVRGISDTWPFYYNNFEYSDIKRIPEGFDEKFFDGPWRRVWTPRIDQKLMLELSLLGRNKENIYMPLITFSYGFHIDANGNYTPYFYKITEPSFFQKMLIMFAK